jgi:hypothetical protein
MVSQDSKDGSAGCDPNLSEALSDLKQAEAHLYQVHQEEGEAERQVATSAAEIEEARAHEQHGFKVEVIYDGVKKPFQVRLQETVNVLREQAIAAFGPIPQPHLLGLFKDGKELPDGETIKQTGVKPHDMLLLRPSTVRGGV